MDLKLNKEQIKGIEKVLTKGDRVELIPIKNGVKILKVKRETIKYPPSKR
jgi:hypothetical protein